DRAKRVAGSEHALDNAFWTSPTPASVWEALERLDPGELNTLVQVFDSMSRVGPAWSFIRWVNNVYIGSSLGFYFVATDLAAPQAALAASPAYCTDTRLGNLLHWGETCFRQVTDDRGLHCCLSPAKQSIHLDWRSPVEYRATDGYCNYRGTAT